MINNEQRPYASLSSGLLARKGAAKPAMRPQGYNGFEDLGWNDMGHEPGSEEGDEAAPPEHVPSSIAALTPLPKAEEPEVVAQQRAIAESFPAEEIEEAEEAEETAEIEAIDEIDEIEEVEAPAPVPAAIVPLPRRRAEPAPRPAVAAGRKAAFTLRLDAERHLRLRLATAVTGRSAQQIVTGALDALLESLPEVEALAERARPNAKSR